MTANNINEEKNTYRYKITIEYLGRKYAGWQRQGHAMSIQQVIEEAIEKFTKEKVIIFGSGRTDSGVNAIEQVAHFDLSKKYDAYKFTGSINFFLKNSEIGILSTKLVNKDFHARCSAKMRHYMYKIVNRREICIIDAEYKTWIKEKLDVEKMQLGSNYLLGKHDFSSFRSSICQAQSPVKTIEQIKIKKIGNNIEISISAISFLHHMVRNIVGTLILVGIGKLEPQKIKEILIAKDRSSAGPTAPSHGLYFMKVDY